MCLRARHLTPLNRRRTTHLLQNCSSKMAASKTSTTIVKSTAKTSSTSTSKTTISDLPELPLLTIFDFIPLPNLLHIDEVCRIWQGLKPAALRRRRHLIIANEPADLEQLAQPNQKRLLRLVLEEDGTPLVKLKLRLDRHALFIGRAQPLRSETVDKVLELLPNLKVFRYVQRYGCYEELWKVKHLLTHYRQQLVEVTICFFGAVNLAGGQRSLIEVQHGFLAMFISLLTTLNRLSALRSLELTFQAAPGCPVDLDDHQLPANCLPDLVGRLTRLKFDTRTEYDGDRLSDHYASDARLLRAVLFRMRDEKQGGAEKAVKSSAGSKSKPQQLEQQQQQPKVQEDLELYVDSTPLPLKTLIPLGPGPVSAGLRTVEIDGIFSGDSSAEYKALARFARQSPHLQALTVSLKCLGIRRLVESLASLQELLYLCINCAANNPPPETVNIRRLPALPSVRSMRLVFPALSHHNYEQLHLEVLFPNLQTVHWIHMGWGCSDCGYLIPEEKLAPYRGDYTARPDARQFRTAYGRRMTTCLRLARLAAFSRLPKLDYLWLIVRPSKVYLPFKDQLFTNCRLSLNRRTEFVELNSEGPNESSSYNMAVYND